MNSLLSCEALTADGGTCGADTLSHFHTQVLVLRSLTPLNNDKQIFSFLVVVFSTKESRCHSLAYRPVLAGPWCPQLVWVPGFRMLGGSWGSL